MLINALNPPALLPLLPTMMSVGELPQQQEQLSIHSTNSSSQRSAATTTPLVALGDLDDDEDAGGHTLKDTVRAAINRRNALRGNLEAKVGEKLYRLVPEDQRHGGKMPFFMHRERGLHLDEREFTVDGVPICATVLGTALTCYWAGQEHARRSEGLFFYIPKTESACEIAIYRDLFTACAELMPHLRLTPLVREFTVKDDGRHALNASHDHGEEAPAVLTTIIRAIILIESLPAVWEMEEMLYALRPYAAGLNAARWDLKASIVEYSMGDPAAVWPDRFGVDVKSTPFLAGIFRRLVAVCLKHRAVAIGGMATALPSRDAGVNERAAASVRADKEWEARQGFIRGWAAHVYHVSNAAAPFVELHASGWEPTPDMADPSNFPVIIEVPSGGGSNGDHVTRKGTRCNVRVLIRYARMITHMSTTRKKTQMYRIITGTLRAGWPVVEPWALTQDGNVRPYLEAVMGEASISQMQRITNLLPRQTWRWRTSQQHA